MTTKQLGLAGAFALLTLVAACGGGGGNGGGGGGAPFGAVFQNAFDQGPNDDPVDVTNAGLSVDPTAEPTVL
ncbi:MAG: hypothetical protein AAGH68_02500 [Pseudomonadota bacterium]